MSQLRQLSIKLGNIPANIQAHGMGGALSLYGERLHENFRDWRLGIHTCGYIEPARLGYTRERADCHEYEAASYRCLDLLFDYLDPGPADVFLDYGCGKGRAVVAAATRPLRRVIGIELSPALAGEARRNCLLAASRLKCRELDILAIDATRYEVPPEVSIVFLFNSFKGAVLSAALERLRESLRRAPRRLRVVYLLPRTAADPLEQLPWLWQAAELPLPRYREKLRLVVYEAVDCEALVPLSD